MLGFVPQPNLRELLYRAADGTGECGEGFSCSDSVILILVCRLGFVFQPNLRAAIYSVLNNIG
jgi:hypothetical protein